MSIENQNENNRILKREDTEAILERERRRRMGSPILHRSSFFNNRPKNISDEAEEIKKRLENRRLAQDIDLKREILNYLKWLLIAETIAVFILSFFQAIKWPLHFDLEEWSFKLLITATIIQITYMLRITVRHLFPLPKEVRR